MSNQVKWLLTDQKRIVEKRWCQLFSDPSQWLDQSAEKVNVPIHVQNLSLMQEDGTLFFVWV
jgi:hypothetical protein